MVFHFTDGKGFRLNYATFCHFFLLPLLTGSELPVVIERTVEVTGSDVEIEDDDPPIVTSIDDVGDIGKGVVD